MEGLSICAVAMAQRCLLTSGLQPGLASSREQEQAGRPAVLLMISGGGGFCAPRCDGMTAAVFGLFCAGEATIAYPALNRRRGSQKPRGRQLPGRAVLTDSNPLDDGRKDRKAIFTKAAATAPGTSRPLRRAASASSLRHGIPSHSQGAGSERYLRSNRSTVMYNAIATKPLTQARRIRELNYTAYLVCNIHTMYYTLSSSALTCHPT